MTEKLTFSKVDQDEEDLILQSDSLLSTNMRFALPAMARPNYLGQYIRWCYGAHSALWPHPLCGLSSESGVLQGDPLGPLLFALVLQRIISVVDMDDECLKMLFHAWLLDDGVLAGTKSAVYLSEPWYCYLL